MIRFSVPSRLQNRALLLRDTENIWCKSFCWIDYSANIETGTDGVAILEHLANLHYLVVCRNGSHTIPVGESVTFRYRVVRNAGYTLPRTASRRCKEIS